MGCVPSKIKRESNEIRIELKEHRSEIEKLKAENDALRRGEGGRTNYAASDDDEDQLMNELDALKKENEKLQEEIMNLKKGNSQVTILRTHTMRGFMFSQVVARPGQEMCIYSYHQDDGAPPMSP
jgi:uncharacterized protein YebE (UPF0316 family)